MGEKLTVNGWEPSSEEEIEKFKTVIKEGYNKAIEKINGYCKEIIKPSEKITINGKEYDVTDVRSVGAKEDKTTETYTSKRITEWASQKEDSWFSNFTDIAKKPNTYYENDFVRMKYWKVATAGNNKEY